MSDAWAGTAYRDLIEEEFKRQEAHTESLQSRGTWVVTSSAGFATLVFAFSRFGSDSLELKSAQSWAGYLAAVALGLFVLAAICGVFTNWPMKFLRVSRAGIDQMLPEPIWTGPRETGEMRAAEARRDQIQVAGRKNLVKVRWLISAMVFEVGAILVLAVALTGAIWPSNAPGP